MLLYTSQMNNTDSWKRELAYDGMILKAESVPQKYYFNHLQLLSGK